jgi:hypothetical protein
MLPDSQTTSAAVGVSHAGDETSKDRTDSGANRISVGGADDAVVRIQLAARWAESFAPDHGDSLRGALERFRQAYEYLDAVTHGIEPQALNSTEQPSHTPAY